MSKTLATFMSVAIVMIILSGLYYGITYQSLKNKHESDNQVIDSYQIQPN